jgi:hypothetical protein
MKRPVYINETNMVNDVIFKNKFVSTEGKKSNFEEQANSRFSQLCEKCLKWIKYLLLQGK